MGKQVLFIISTCLILFPSFSFSYEIGSSYEITLKSGKIIRGTIVSESASTVVVKDKSGKYLTLKKTTIVSPEPQTLAKNGKKEGARTYDVEDLKHISELSTIASSEKSDLQGQTYGGEGQEIWITDVLGVAVRVRKAEEAYEKFYRACGAQSSDQSATTAAVEANEVVQENSDCTKAKEALALAEHARRQYQLILDRAARASVPVEWLRAHFAWVRWAPEWERTENTEFQQE